MTGLKPLGLALLAAMSSGCIQSTDNAGNSPIINTPGRTDVTAQVTFPASHLAIQGLDTVTNTTILTQFVAFGFDFSNPDHLLEYFIPGGTGTITSNVEKDALLVVEAFDPATEDMLGAVIGFNTSDLPDPVVVNINAMTDAIADLLVASSPDLEGGVIDDIKPMSLEDVFSLAAINQLVVEGNSRADAEMATQVDRDAALDRLLTAASPGLAEAQSYIQMHLDGSTWQSGSSTMAVTFDGAGLTYTDPSGNVETGTYELRRSSSVTYLDFNLSSSGATSVTIDSLIGGGNIFTLLGEDLVRQ